MQVEGRALSQVTIYLDEETATKMKQAARSQGLSQSQWVARLIRERTSNEWPPSVAELAGAWADLPLSTEIRSTSGVDADREAL